MDFHSRELLARASQQGGGEHDVTNARESDEEQFQGLITKVRSKLSKAKGNAAGVKEARLVV
jgi:hypothetical protein